MDAQARAGIDLYGTVMRYAEVEHYGASYRLLRLGSCDFEFDVAHEVLYAKDPAHLETVAEAISDVFAGSIATDLHVAVHPPGCYSFFTQVPGHASDEDRLEQIRREATLLSQVEEPDSLYLTADVAPGDVVQQGEPLWYHVLGMQAHVHARFQHVLRVLPQAGYRPVVSMQGVAYTVNRLESRESRPAAPFTLAIGVYPSHFEYTLCRDGHWSFSHYAAFGQAADCAYFALALLQRLNLSRRMVGRVLLYGADLDLPKYDVLKTIFEVDLESLNPLPVVDLDPGSLAASFDVEAYVPCIGVAL